MNSLISALLVALVFASVDQSLREAAREHGGTASNSINYFDPVTPVNSLMAKADVVVHARVRSSRTLLIHNDMFVATEYTIVPLQVLKQRSFLSMASKPGMPTKALVVRRAGGTMVEGPYRYSTTNSSMPEEEAPKVGDEVIWFLQYDQENATFTFTAGPFSAFRVIDGAVRPLTKEAANRRGDVPTDLVTFLLAIREQNAVRH